MVALIITEKPSVADDLAKVLGAKKGPDHHESDSILITWAVGHLLTQVMPEEYDEAFKDWRKSSELLPLIPETFKLKPRDTNAKKRLSRIRALLKNHHITEIVNACDAAREGELIFTWIAQHLRIKVPTTRMWIQSMTDHALQDAWDRRQDADLYRNLRFNHLQIRIRLDHRHEWKSCRPRPSPKSTAGWVVDPRTGPNADPQDRGRSGTRDPQSCPSTLLGSPCDVSTGRKLMDRSMDQD